MSKNTIEEYFQKKKNRERYEKQNNENTNTKKEKLIQALVKELGSSKDKEKRIRKVVNKYL